MKISTICNELVNHSCFAVLPPVDAGICVGLNESRAIDVSLLTANLFTDTISGSRYSFLFKITQIISSHSIPRVICLFIWRLPPPKKQSVAVMHSGIGGILLVGKIVWRHGEEECLHNELVYIWIYITLLFYVCFFYMFLNMQKYIHNIYSYIFQCIRNADFKVQKSSPMDSLERCRYTSPRMYIFPGCQSYFYLLQCW